MKRVLISFFVAMVLIGSNIPNANAATNVTSDTSTASGANTSSSDTSTTDANSSSNAANTDNSIKISLANIQEIILENNQQAKIYDNSRDNTKLSYDIAKDAYDTANTDYNTANTAYSTAEEAYKTAEEAYSAGTTTSEPSNSDVTSAENTLNTDKTALDDAKKTLDTEKYDLRTANITYNTELENLVKTAQTDYITYVLSDLPSNDYDTANLDYLKKAADIAQVQYNSGFLSKDAYTTAQLAYTTALNTSNKTNDAAENDKAKLLYDLGLSSGENVTFDTNLEQDLKDVSTINYDADLTEMFNNSLNLQKDNIAIEQASDNKDNYENQYDNSSDDNYDNKDEQYDNSLKTAQSQLVLDKNSSEKDFKTNYDALTNAYAAMKNSSDSLNQRKDEYNTTIIQYNYGFASQQDVNKANADSLNESQSFQSTKKAFYEAYLSYIEAKEGY